MFAERLGVAISGARTLARLDQLAPLIWRAHAADAIADDVAQQLAELLHAAKSESRNKLEPIGIPFGRETIFTARRYQFSPDRRRSIERRRKLVLAGPMPPSLGFRFSLGELAVTKIIGDEVRSKGCCDRTVAEIAARAGVCRSLVQRALRQAARLGLITIQERRRRGQKNLSNIVRIVSREWLIWLKRGRQLRSEPIGSTKNSPTPTGLIPPGYTRRAPAEKRLSDKEFTAKLAAIGRGGEEQGRPR